MKTKTNPKFVNPATRPKYSSEELKKMLSECYECNKLTEQFTVAFISVVDSFIDQEDKRRYPLEMREDFKGKVLINLVLNWRKFKLEGFARQCFWVMISRLWFNFVRDSQRDGYAKLMFAVNQYDIG
jgi:hypothetical protein